MAVLVIGVEPFAHWRLGGTTSFVPAVVALVGCLDLLCAVLLIRQFLDMGEPRMLALAMAYVTSIVLIIGYGAAFPKVLGDHPPLGHNLSTAPWLWAAWHTSFPVLLGSALAPWPASWQRLVPAPARRARMLRATAAFAACAALLVTLVVTFDSHLPKLINGSNTHAMSRLLGPVMLPLVVVGTAFAIIGGWRQGGPARWAGLAASTALADVILTLSSKYRYSFGWYVGRTLTVTSSAVVLVALLAAFSGIKSRLAAESERLRTQLDRTDALERLQQTLLTNMADGVVMRHRSGKVVASNPAAHRMLGLTSAQLADEALRVPGWRLLSADGKATTLNPPAQMLDRSEDPRAIFGVERPDGKRHWFLSNTSIARDDAGELEYSISSLTDISERYAAEMAVRTERRHAKLRIERVLRDHAFTMVFQPIVNLASGAVVGVEALARFTGPPVRTPDVWFREAAESGLGVRLELAAIESALAQLDLLPRDAYMSVNASPNVLTSTAFFDVLSKVDAHRVVVELTEHVTVEDYAGLNQAFSCLRRAGVRLAVDDTGAGYASLRHVLRLRPEIIKLDLELTRGLRDDPARRALAVALLAFGRELGAQIVAEGIETAEDMCALQELGIQQGQGYLLGRASTLPLTTPLHLPLTDRRPALRATPPPVRPRTPLAG